MYCSYPYTSARLFEIVLKVIDGPVQAGTTTNYVPTRVTPIVHRIDPDFQQATNF